MCPRIGWLTTPVIRIELTPDGLGVLMHATSVVIAATEGSFVTLFA